MEMINVVRQRSVFSSSSEPLPGRWIACPDSFLLGPSDVDPERHTTKRFAYWQAVGEALGLDWIVRRGPEEGLNCVGNVVGQGDLLKAIERLMLPGIGLRIWSADCCQDRIFVSWVLHALSQANIELPTTQYCKIPRYGIGEEDIDQLGSQAATISAVDMAYGSDIWAAFANGQPDRLYDLCLADCSSANRLDLSGIAREYSRLFPRWYDDLLQVSDFDAAILNCLSTESWRTPRDLAIELIDKIPRLEDLEVAYRIDQWAAHLDGHGAVIKKELADGKSSFTRVTYRLTKRGQQILREGLDDLSDAPELLCGGNTLYRGRESWVFTGEGFTKLH
jgi:hypothetical protein